jgi:hypothetical protein
MYKFLLAGVLSATMTAPALAFNGNYIGPGITFGLGPGSDVSFGLESKFDVAPNWSLRPAIAFGNGGTLYGASVTYNLGSVGKESTFTPFVGGGVSHYSRTSSTAAVLNLGLDYQLSKEWVFLTKINIPLSNDFSTGFNFSAGYQF